MQPFGIGVELEIYRSSTERFCVRYWALQRAPSAANARFETEMMREAGRIPWVSKYHGCKEEVSFPVVGRESRWPFTVLRADRKAGIYPAAPPDAFAC